MSSFDIVSEVDTPEVTNAVDQATRELTQRFDFKGVKASFTLDESKITLKAPSDFQVTQMYDILTGRLAARQIDVRCLKVDPPQVNVGEAWQVITVRSGLETELAKKIVKEIKKQKFKVQAAIQGEQVRVSAKKRDLLQEVIAFLKEAKFEMPLQYVNFRD